MFILLKNKLKERKRGQCNRCFRLSQSHKLSLKLNETLSLNLNLTFLSHCATSTKVSLTTSHQTLLTIGSLSQSHSHQTPLSIASPSISFPIAHISLNHSESCKNPWLKQKKSSPSAVTTATMKLKPHSFASSKQVCF